MRDYLRRNNSVAAKKRNYFVTDEAKRLENGSVISTRASKKYLPSRVDLELHNKNNLVTALEGKSTNLREKLLPTTSR